MQINLKVANTPDSIQMTMDNLACVEVIHNTQQTETFVVSLEDLYDLGYFDNVASDESIYQGIVAKKRQTVLQ